MVTTRGNHKAQVESDNTWSPGSDNLTAVVTFSRQLSSTWSCHFFSECGYAARRSSRLQTQSSAAILRQIIATNDENAKARKHVQDLQSLEAKLVS